MDLFGPLWAPVGVHFGVSEEKRSEEKRREEKRREEKRREEKRREAKRREEKRREEKMYKVLHKRPRNAQDLLCLVQRVCTTLLFESRFPFAC